MNKIDAAENTHHAHLWCISEDESKVNMHEMAISTHQNICIVPVLDLEDVTNKAVTDQGSKKVILGLVE